MTSDQADKDQLCRRRGPTKLPIELGVLDMFRERPRDRTRKHVFSLHEMVFHLKKTDEDFGVHFPLNEESYQTLSTLYLIEPGLRCDAIQPASPMKQAGSFRDCDVPLSNSVDRSLMEGAALKRCPPAYPPFLKEGGPESNDDNSSVHRQRPPRRFRRRLSSPRRLARRLQHLHTHDRPSPSLAEAKLVQIPSPREAA